MKKALLITTAIIGFLALMIWLLFKSNGYELPKADKYTNIPYFPQITNSANFSNVALDTMHVINYYANQETIFVKYSKTKDIYRTCFLKLANKSFKNLAYRKVTENDIYDLDTTAKLLFIAYKDTSGISNCEIIDITNGNLKNLKEIDKKNYNSNKEKFLVVKHLTSIQNTSLLFFKNNLNQYFYIKNEVANEVAKTITLAEDKNFNFLVSIIIGGDPEIKHQNINLFDNVVTGSKFKRILSIPTPSSNSSTNVNRMIKNEGYLEDKGWFDKSRIYYFKMKLKTDEVKFKTDIYYFSETYFDQLNNPKSNQDTLFYFSGDKIYKFFKK